MIIGIEAEARIPPIFSAIKDIMKKQIEQAELFKDEGMERAKEHADRECYEWSLKAMDCLKEFLEFIEKPFMTEDVRAYAHGPCNLEIPPSSRAWGSIMTNAARNNLITMIGYHKTTNPKAHRTPASLWIKKSS